MVDLVRRYNNYGDLTAIKRCSLKNGDIPGRGAKHYWNGYYAWVENPGQIQVQNFYSGSSSTTFRVAGLDVNRRLEADDFRFEPFQHPRAGEVSSLLDDKLITAAQKARDNGFNLAVFTAELPAALKMFANTATRIFKSYHTLRKGDIVGSYKALGMDYKGRVPRKEKVRLRASNYWLEMSYGWKPLLSDIDSAARKVAHEIHGSPRHTVRAKASADQVAEDPFTTGFNGVSITQYRELQVQGVLTYELSSPFIAHAASLGFTNPMAIAWEVLPMSFVFDWLIPVGDWLTKFSAFHGLSLVDGSLTRKGRLDTLYSYKGIVYPDVYTRIFPGEPVEGVLLKVESRHRTPASILVKESGFTRDKMTSFPSVPWPRLKFPTSLAKATTALALLVQRKS